MLSFTRGGTGAQRERERAGPDQAVDVERERRGNLWPSGGQVMMLCLDMGLSCATSDQCPPDTRDTGPHITTERGEREKKVF